MFYIEYIGEVANVLNCNIVVSEIELQLRYCVHFWTNTSYKSNRTTNVLQQE